MVQRIFSVYDLKTKAFLQPFFSPEVGSAMRAFGDAVADGKSPLAAHPEDYQLFELGNFDDLSGSVLGVSPARLLCSGNDFVKVDVKPAVPVSWPAVGSVPEAVSNGGSR